MLALIDADIVLYRVGFTTNNESSSIAKFRTDDMMDGILLGTDASSFRAYLSDSKENNFRFQIYPKYKANRVAPRPIHYDVIKEHLITGWGATFAFGMEADDALGIDQTPDSIICSIDKDLKQIPGKHYNIVTGEISEVSYWEGLKFFYEQLLVGDSVDNIQGCWQIGKAKATKALQPILEDAGEEKLFDCVLKLYKQQHQGPKTKFPLTDQQIYDHILMIGRLLKIKQHEEEELWTFPKSQPQMAPQPLSTQPMQVENSPFTVQSIVEKAGVGSLDPGMPKAELTETAQPI